MGRTSRKTRTISRLLIVGVVAATTLVAFTGTSWASDRTHAAEELSFASKINAERAERGLNRLTVNLQLTGVARAWADVMAGDGAIAHNPRLGSQVEGDWTRLGENVGYSSRANTSGEEFVRRLHVAFMESPGHRANVLGEYNQVGVGVRMTGNTMWVTVNFMKAATVVSNRSVKSATDAAARQFVAEGRDGKHAAYAVVTASNQRSHKLGAAALAGNKGAVLYTHPANRWDESPVLHPQTRASIDRLLGGGGLVYVVGGTNHVSAKAVAELTNDGYTVRRLNRSTVPATLVHVAKETIRRHGNTERVVIGRTNEWRSSKRAARWAASNGIPFVVSNGKRLSPAVRDFLGDHRPDKRWVAGDRDTISLRVQRAAHARRIT